MIDLILVKFIESALNSVNRPKGGFYIRIESDTHNRKYIYYNRPTSIEKFKSRDMIGNPVEYTTFIFPIPTMRDLYIDNKLTRTGLENDRQTFASTRIMDMGYL
jgi:hypothetical protein